MTPNFWRTRRTAMKVVVSTHPRYHDPLTRTLQALLRTGDARDVIVVVADDADGAHGRRVSQEHPDLAAVLSHATNNYEYTSFAAVGEAIRDRGAWPDDAHFLMIHDTVVPGDGFWPKARALGEQVKNMGVGLWRPTMWDLIKGHARGLRPLVVAKTWFPACNSFNIGMASRPLLMRCAAVYAGPISKNDGVLMETDKTHPFSLATLSGPGGWEYLAGPCFSIKIVAEGDVYDTGVVRRRMRLDMLDLDKVLVPCAARDHPDAA